MKKGVFYIAVVILLCYACNPSNKTSKFPFKTLCGTWKLDDKNVYESWDCGNGIFNAYVYSIGDNDTIINEHIELRFENKKTYYIATVLQQNNGNPVNYILTQYSDSSFTVINKDHDFPQKIEYIFQSPNRLKAIISGNIKNKERKIIFNYTKI